LTYTPRDSTINTVLPFPKMYDLTQVLEDKMPGTQDNAQKPYVDAHLPFIKPIIVFQVILQNISVNKIMNININIYIN
jgi:hypothetical protein